MNNLIKSKLLPFIGAGILLLAGLGAAAIPGAVTGDAPAVVQQSITVTAAKSTLASVDTAGTASADGTSFFSPITVATGDNYTTTLTLSNKSKMIAAALMTVTLPAGFTLTAVSGASTQAQIGPATWLLTFAPPTAPATAASLPVVLAIRTDDTLTPGFYTISATIKQVEG